MIIDSSIVKSQQSSGVATNIDSSVPNPDSSTSSAATSVSGQSSSVTISGRSLMLSRLFGNKEPVKPSGDLLSDTNMRLSPVNFLTASDKDLLSKMYEFAQQQGADLQHVDSIAVSLGIYHQTNDSRNITTFNNPYNFDLEGHQVTVSFNAEDTKTVARILNSDSINSTQLDHGFLQHILDPGSGALSMISDFKFLEQMVTKFSDKGANVTLDSKFSTYDISSVPQRNAVFTKSKEVLNPNPAATFVADYTSIDGVGHWRTPELAAAAASHGGMGLSANSLNATTINALLGKLHTKTTTKDNQMMNLLDLMFKSNTKN